MGFEEDLVAEVRKYDVLYNMHSAEYKNTILKDQIWSEIAARLGVSEKVCKKRWGSLRETYFKIERCLTLFPELSSGKAAPRSKPSKYLRLLVFLDDMWSIMYSEKNSYIGSKKEKPIDISDFLDMASESIPNIFSSAEKTNIRILLMLKFMAWRLECSNFTPQKKIEIATQMWKMMADKIDEFSNENDSDE